MPKQTNRVAWGLAATLSAVLVLGIARGVQLYAGVVGLSISTKSVCIISAEERRGYPGGAWPWPGQIAYACGPGVSRITQVYRKGAMVRVVCYHIVYFPWDRW
jgi:hypothetical protein